MRDPHAAASLPSAAGPSRRLSLLDAVAILVGIIIGAGLFETSPQLARLAAGPWELAAVWLLGGAFALVGAVVYAELATAYPDEGGEYVYLSRAFGRGVGFLFAWVQFWVVRPGSIGAMAYVYARYADQLAPLGGHSFFLHAVGAIGVLTALNLAGVRGGARTQNLLTAAKVVGLLVVVGLGLFGGAAAVVAPPDAAAAAAPAIRATDWNLALILVLWTYSGWNEMPCVAAEVRRPEQNIGRALLLGTLAVVAVYLLANLAFVRGLGLEGFRASRAVAADVVRPFVGDAGARLVALLVCVSTLGAINGMILTGARIYYALGREHPMLGWLGVWDARWGVPLRALMGQAAVTLAVVAGLEWRTSQESAGGAFERLVIFTAPLFWGFLLLTGLALFVLRRRDPERPRPFRVPGYPLTAVLFLCGAAFMLQAATQYAIGHRAWEGLWAVGSLAAGVAAYVAFDRRAA